MGDLINCPSGLSKLSISLVIFKTEFFSHHMTKFGEFFTRTAHFVVELLHFPP